MYNLGITQILFLQNKHVSIFLILTKQDCKCDFLKNFGLYYLLNSQLFPSLIESGRQPLKLSDPVGWKQLNRRLLTQWVMTWCCMISDGNGILEIRRRLNYTMIENQNQLPTTLEQGSQNHGGLCTLLCWPMKWLTE